MKAEVQKKLKVDKQQQLEGMCAELETANTKGNSRQVFQRLKSMTRKFQPRLQCIQSAIGENLTEAAQIADRWKGYCATCRRLWYGNFSHTRTPVTFMGDLEAWLSMRGPMCETLFLVGRWLWRDLELRTSELY